VIDSAPKTAKSSRTSRPFDFLRRCLCEVRRYATANLAEPLLAGEVHEVREGYFRVRVPRVWVRLGTPPFRGVPSVPRRTRIPSDVSINLHFGDLK
jgi:hypothetical protein